MLQHPAYYVPNFHYYMSSDRLREFKKRYFKRLVLKVVTVAYRRWSLTKGSKYSELRDWQTFGVLANWSLKRGGRLATRGGRNWRLDCTSADIHVSAPQTLQVAF